MLPIPAPLTGDVWALFLDVDGTLLEIAAAPDLVRVDPRLLKLLDSLHRASSGALALISGRSIADLDGLFAPLVLPVAGLHGAERRDACGLVHRRPEDPRLREACRQITAWCASRPGALVEDKAGAVALHFRSAPALEAPARGLLQGLLDRLGGDYVLQEGKLVLELRPSGFSKATAIRQFMAEAPFAGRRPVFVGDDITDEAGFAATLDLGGLAVVVGDGEGSRATHALPDVGAVQKWLERSLAGGLR
jgi:trehalose 6-phosphate phosphatase